MKIYLLLVLFITNVISVCQTHTVQFKVDMRVKTCKMEFKPAIDNIYIMGNFNGWQAKSKMNDDDRDTIYTYSLGNLNTDSTIVFKFFYPESNWEFGDDRILKVKNQDQVFIDFFDRDSSFKVVDFWND